MLSLRIVEAAGLRITQATDLKITQATGLKIMQATGLRIMLATNFKTVMVKAKQFYSPQLLTDQFRQAKYFLLIRLGHY